MYLTSCCLEMLQAVISAGTQNADVKKHFSHYQLDRVVDCVRLFDRSVLFMSEL